MSEKVRYGVDGWPYLLALGCATAVCATGSAFARRWPVVAWLLGGTAFGASVPLALGTHYVMRGKHVLRDRLLGEVAWTGDEVVVDLGVGAGLLAIGAAQRTRGSVHAVDLFVGKDLSGNSEGRLRANAAAAGVADRLVVHVRDVRDSGLPDAGADVVVSTLCLHNIADADGRRSALDEVARIVRPGGTVLISDLAHVDDEYAPYLRTLGFRVVCTGRAAGTFPPQRVLVAQAPQQR